MSVQPQTEQGQAQNDVFTVELPWGLPKDSPFVINELEFPIIQLQQLIIEDLESKLEAKAAPRNKKLGELFDAMKADRDDILAKHDRAKAETDVMRRDRNRFMKENDRLNAENDELFDAKTELEEKLAKTQTELRHALDELAGVPKRIENSVKAALAEKSGASHEQVAELEQKLQEKSGKIASLNERNQILEAKDKEQTKAIENLVEIKVHADELMAVSDCKFDELQTKLEDTIAYTTLLTLECDRLTNDNMYLTLIREYDELRTIYEKDDWRVIVFCRASALGELARTEDIPHADFAVCFAMNEQFGGGHFVYLNSNKELVFPPDLDSSLIISEDHHEGLREGFIDAHLERYSAAVDRSVHRIRNVVKAAPYMEIKNSHFPESLDITRVLMDHVPREIINTAQKSIDAINRLVPTSDAQINRINKRFGTEFPPVRDQHWQRKSTSNAMNTPKTSGSKKPARKKTKKRK
jgi:hypothetical protein